jgi:DNA repair protein RadC
MINLIKDKAQQYGYNTLTDSELAKIAKLPENYIDSAQYKAAKELMRREKIQDLTKITGSGDVYSIMKFLSDVDHEEMHVLYLNRANKIIRSDFHSKGGITGTVVCVKEVLKQAVQLKAHGVILVHNHPSGNNQPSSADVEVTRKIKEALKFVDSQLLDHVIIAKDKYYSFTDEGVI